MVELSTVAFGLPVVVFGCSKGNEMETMKWSIEGYRERCPFEKGWVKDGVNTLVNEHENGSVGPWWGLKGELET